MNLADTNGCGSAMVQAAQRISWIKHELDAEIWRHPDDIADLKQKLSRIEK
jgi:hypothetical protein